jgi:hypothetical protein
VAGYGGAAAVGGGDAADGCGDDERDDKDRLDLDTRLSNASNPWVAGPRLRSS